MELNRTLENDVADEIISNLTYEGIEPEDSIPGLVRALKVLCDNDPDALQEAIDMLDE